MITPNIEELMALADRYATLRIGEGTANARKELHDAMQSQAARIKELEAEIITRTSYGDEQTDFAIKLAAERDALRAELDAIAATEPRAYEVYQKCSTKYSTLTYDTSKVPEVFVGGTVNPLFTRPMPPIIGLQDVHDAITSDPTLAESNAEFDESQFKSVEDLIAYLNKLNSYRDKTLEALSKYKGAK